jgi:hypothetical protein
MTEPAVTGYKAAGAWHSPCGLRVVEMLASATTAVGPSWIAHMLGAPRKVPTKAGPAPGA